MTTSPAPIRRPTLQRVIRFLVAVRRSNRRTAGDTDSFVRAETARALGRSGTREATSHLERLARDGVARVRAAACEALGHIETASAEHGMRAARDPSPAVRAASVRLLGRGVTGYHRRELERLAVDDSARVRGVARRALEALRTTPP